jgi:hypothetical protein
MDFETLTKEVEKEEQAKVNAPKYVGKPAINEQKLFELEQAIEAEWQVADLGKKGCFGKLVRLADNEICQACKDADACEKELLDSGKEQIADAENEIETIVSDNQLDGELIKLAKAKPNKAEIDASPILKQIYDAADKVKASLKPEAKPVPKAEPKTQSEPEQKIAVEVPSEIAGIDLSDLGKRSKVAFDFNWAKDMILTEQPADFKRVRKICLELIDDVYLYGSTAYRNANKIMAELQKLGVLTWNAETKKIEYNI